MCSSDLELKKMLQEAPILAAPRDKEPLLLYIAVTTPVVSVVIVVERPEEGKEQSIQRHVYYISEVLSESKQRYPQYQKLVYTVFMAQRRLRHYFQEHPITVVCSHPLGDIIRNREAIGRVAKWTVEIGVFDLKYVPRTAIKSQAMADFLVDWMEAQQPEPLPDQKRWSLFFDGAMSYEIGRAHV